MIKRNKQIDVYIVKSADFAVPILEHFRALVHKTCPEVEEKMKWSFPHFDYQGEMMCSMAAFKQHCAIGFWKASLMTDAIKLKGKNDEAMGHYGRISSLKMLPPDKIIISNIREAMKLNEKGIKLPPKKKSDQQAVLKIPPEFQESLSENIKTRIIFESFSPSHKREYVEWISDAKTETTRNKRIAQAVEWISDGKSRNWKYVKKNS